MMRVPLPHVIEITVANNTRWYLDVVTGRLFGVIDDEACPQIVHEFYIGNPPAPDDVTRHVVFSEICELAVSQGVLRRICTYAVQPNHKVR